MHLRELRQLLRSRWGMVVRPQSTAGARLHNAQGLRNVGGTRVQWALGMMLVEAPRGGVYGWDALGAMKATAQDSAVAAAVAVALSAAQTLCVT